MRGASGLVSSAAPSAAKAAGSATVSCSARIQSPEANPLKTRSSSMSPRKQSSVELFPRDPKVQYARVESEFTRLFGLSDSLSWMPLR